MRIFAFQFDALLKLRRHRRDLCRQLLAQVLASDRELIAQREDLERARLGQLGELRELGREGEVDVDRTATRRYYAGQLAGRSHAVERNRELVTRQLLLCRQALAESDRDVKVLEKLEEREKAAFRYAEERHEARELEDAWRGTRRREVFG